MKATERIAANLFGAIFITLALAVTAETLLRKLFGTSLQGVDELGGYALALGSTIAFTLALLDRSHIRIDLIHRRLPRSLRTALNLVSMLLMAGLALSLCGMAWIQVRETLDYGSTAPTPWATPLIYPQSAWFAGLVLFTLASLALLLRGIWLLRAGRREDFDRDYGPRGLEDELREELDDLRQRGLTTPDAGAPTGPEVTA
ncbi:TRAP transporter small permease protein [Marinobacterium nitratireducens]|uniref:TRAP transporter small permease protein n=1 Tax=Marinobacterium nitratireducens TaxID=518897 RepID=A0A917ZNQ9_9GAMM|nr:TRAP transporter small permease [Marinobacterium nitratireducens]GGO86875.1 TRAP transporter small permease protein [Marinobacterium nitratireducens]